VAQTTDTIACMASRDYVSPQYKERSFNCPHCDTFAHQVWWQVRAIRHITDPGRNVPEADVSKCDRCGKDAYWIDEQLVFPPKAQAPLPHEDMPEDVRDDYLEARDLAGRSPRAACALLRLALQKLCVHLGESGQQINADIAALVQKGLPVQIQRALDTPRVVGNNAVHPGEMDLRDDVATATALFDVMNIIVEQQISQPRQLHELYDNLPEAARSAIEDRDATP
jgi:Domain of unknown function (DUF4145)